MRDGSWGAGSVRSVTAQVDGLPAVTAESVSVQRTLPSALPGQAAGVGGWEAATASVAGHVGDGVVERVGTPFNRKDWPAPGDPVTVDVSDGSNTHQVFTGQVDTSSSSLAAPEVSVGLVDTTDRLSAKVSERALFQIMPPRSTQNDGYRRITGLRNLYPVDLAARAAGFYQTPPMDGYCVISAPLCGSTWPERGELERSHQADDDGMHFTWRPAVGNAAGTMYVGNVYAEYVRKQYGNDYSGGITATRPMSITIGAAPTHAGNSYVEARWEGIGTIVLSVTLNRTLVVRVTNGDGKSTTVMTHYQGDVGDWLFATLRVSRVSEYVLGYELQTDTGFRDYKEDNTAWAQMRDKQWDRIRLRGNDGAWLTGLQVSYTRNQAACHFDKTFNIRTNRAIPPLEVMPALVAETAGDILKGVAEADGSAVWIDEAGVLQWRGHERLVEQTVKRTLTASQVADASIVVDSQDVRRRVTLKAKHWKTRTTRESSLVAYEGPKDEYRQGDQVETIISPPAEEQWVMVDTSPRMMFGNIGATWANEGLGTLQGYTPMRADGSEVGFPDNDGSTTRSFEPVGPAAWKWYFKVDSLATGVDRIKTATRSEENTYLKPAYRDLGLPLVRCMGIATSTDIEVTATGGPSWAPDLELDVDWYIQDQDALQAKANWVMAELKTVRPKLTGFEVLADPRIQLADKITMVDDVRTGLSITGVVTGLDQSVEDAGHTMKLDLMVTSVSTSSVTLAEFDAWYSGMTLAELDSKLKGQTLAELDANPLQ